MTHYSLGVSLQYQGSDSRRAELCHTSDHMETQERYPRSAMNVTRFHWTSSITSGKEGYIEFKIFGQASSIVASYI